MTACDACLRRTWLLARLAPNLERARRDRRALQDVLALEDRDLVAALAGRQSHTVLGELRAIRPVALRAAVARAGVDPVCRHDDRYPARLRFGAGAPAVLHVAGRRRFLEEWLGDADAPAAAVVGARRASPDGIETARALGRGLAAAGITVVSGMALGIDAAAHVGALEAGGPTIAVLAGGADVPYPRSKHRLYRELVERQCVISEMPPGVQPFKWTFPARNRTIAALGHVTVVVEAAERSGSLITADFAADFGRQVAAVPGGVTAPQSRGTNALIMDGAALVRHARDVLDLLFGAGGGPAEPDPAASLEPRLRTLLSAVESGRDTVSAIARTPEAAQAAMVGLAELELLGLVRRDSAGRYARVIA